MKPANRLIRQRYLFEPLETRRLLTADFDGDGRIGVQDLDALTVESAAGTNDEVLDLNRDGAVDRIDVDEFLRGFGLVEGDANLDGTVNLADFGLLSDNYGVSGPWSKGDFNADGEVGFRDFLLLSRSFGTISEMPSIESIQVFLPNDSGEPGDLLTSDPSLRIEAVGRNLAGAELTVVVDSGESEEVRLDESGRLTFSPGLSLIGESDGPHEIQVSSALLSEVLVFDLDTVAPSLSDLRLASEFRQNASDPFLANSSEVTILGTTEPAQVVSLLPGEQTATANEDGVVRFDAIALSEGANSIELLATDDAGNTASSTVSIQLPVTDADGGLRETDAWLTSETTLIELGEKVGSRKVVFDVSFEPDTSDESLVGDLFQVYLVDPTNPTSTILDRGTPGESLFSLGENGADFLAGVVTFDGTTVEIDASNVAESSGLLVFQLINGDGDIGTTAAVSNLQVVSNEDGAPAPTLTARSSSTRPGEAVDLSNFIDVSADTRVFVDNVRADEENGTYIADITVQNVGPALSKALAIKFEGLPDEVLVSNATGTFDSSTYVNLSNYVPVGGLDRGSITPAFEVTIINPNLEPFELAIDVLSTGQNQAPVIAPIANSDVMPGDAVSLSLAASDPDGDSITFSIPNGQELPPMVLRNGTLTLTPRPEDIGTYTVEVVAKDRISSSATRFTLNVVSDEITTTRLSGSVFDSDGTTPLAGVPVELNGTVTTTDIDGSFEIEVGTLTPDDVLKVHGNQGEFERGTYPFVAEKVGLILPQEPLSGFNNVVGRPIYLPILDVAGGREVDPSSDTMVEQEIAPGDRASVNVAAGSLMMDDGSGGETAFNGTLSITEVPRDFTPAALPNQFRPSTVVTIQPGEMQFTVPAPLTLPNREGFLPGRLMDLWSINPNTGLFEEVGLGRVSEDGSVIETVEGGIRNSSWHFFVPEDGDEEDEPVPPVQNLVENVENQDLFCGSEHTEPVNSELELHSGAIREQHDLVTYDVLGSTHGLTLHYDSQRADPRPIIYFGLTGDLGVVSTGVQDLALVGRVLISRGNYAEYVEGYGGNRNVAEDFDHFWSLPESVLSDSSAINAAAQGDLSDQPSGIYQVTAESALFVVDGFFEGSFVTSVSAATVPLVHVNASSSEFGAGWELGGMQSIVENPGGELLLLDGNGDDLVFLRPESSDDAYVSPPGDFTELRKNEDGTYTRVSKHRTVYEFDDEGRLTSVTDRNGNRTEHRYENNQLVEIVDAVGLSTTLSYEDGRVTSITDPADRTTTLSYNHDGQLVQIIDPDEAARTFEYDSLNHLVREEDQEGNVEETVYGPHGRAQSSIRKDGTELDYEPLQTRILEGIVGGTAEEEFFPTAQSAQPEGVALTTDSDGNVRRTVLDQAGQFVSSSDQFGQSLSLTRTANNLVGETQTGRRFETNYEYDESGNLVSVIDEIVRSNPTTGSDNGDGGGDNGGGGAGGEFFSTDETFLQVGNDPQIVTGDFNSDGSLDLLTANFHSRDFSVLLNDGNGGFLTETRLPLGLGDMHPQSITSADFNGDGNVDFASSNGRLDEFTFDLVSNFTIWIGDGAGGFSIGQRSADGPDLGHLFTGDFDGDSVVDLISSGSQTGASTRSPSIAFRGIGDGTFVQAAFIQDQFGNSGVVAVADFNGDDLSDVLHRTQRVLLSNGSEFNYQHELLDEFPSSTDETAPYVIGFFNSDRILDIVVTDYSRIDDQFQFQHEDRLFIGIGDGTFEEGVIVDVADGFGPTTAADLNGDGLDDLVAPGINVHLSNGNGFDTAEMITIEDSATVAVGDFDNDDAIDIVSGTGFDRNGSRLNILRNQLGGSFGGEDLSAKARTYTYEPGFNQLTGINDELGRETIFEIDEESGNRLSSTIVMDGGGNIVERFTYTENGLIDRATDPLGRITDFDYNDRGLVTSITFAVGTDDEAIQRFEYDEAGNQTAIVDENGNRTEYRFDIMNRLVEISETDPDGIGSLSSPETSFSYDRRGNLASTTDAEGSTASNRYDPMDRLVSTTDEDGNQIGNRYNEDGNLVRETDQNGNVTTHRYDARDRLTKTIDPDGGETRFSYDQDDNLTSLTDPNGNTTTYVYDARNRLIKETDPLGNRIDYAYDAVDNLIQKTDRNKRVTAFTYDNADRLLTEQWTSSEGTLENSIAYSYDLASNLLNATDSVSALTYAYDSRNRVASVDNTDTLESLGLPAVVLNYAYDDVGNVLGVEEIIDGISGATTSYEYDGLNRATEITQSGGDATEKLVDFVYNQLGQFDEISRYSDLSRANVVARTDYRYDDLNRLLALEHGRTTESPRDIAFYDFEYDAASRITAIVDADGRTEYAYDEQDQLTTATRGETDERGNEEYSYDLNGNRVSSHVHGEAYVTGAANRLLSDGTHNYEYDDEGNMVRRTNIETGFYRVMEYDHRNRLVRVRDLTPDDLVIQLVEFVYDTVDRRIAKRVSSGAGETTEHYIYDREDVLLDFVDVDGTLTDLSPELARRYVFGPGIDNIIAQQEIGGTSWILTDHLGSTRHIIDDTSVSLLHFDFDSYGVPLAASDWSATRYLFAGREWDPTTELYYLRNRFYSQDLGRFLSEDPIRFSSGDSNLLSYVSNNPMSFRDPLGLDRQHFDKATTKRLIEKASTDSWWQTPFNHIGKNDLITGATGIKTGQFDFKMMVGESTFQVGNRTLRADEFGNYLAGYVGATRFGPIGVAGVWFGGVAFNFVDTLKFGLYLTDVPSYWNCDLDSLPDIAAGVFGGFRARGSAPRMDMLRNMGYRLQLSVESDAGRRDVS